MPPHTIKASHSPSVTHSPQTWASERQAPGGGRRQEPGVRPALPFGCAAEAGAWALAHTASRGLVIYCVTRLIPGSSS